MNTIKTFALKVKLPALLLGILIVVGVAIMLFNQKQHVNATWIWDLEQLNGKPGEAIEFMEKENINRVYVHIDFGTFAPGPYREFIQKATEADMEVYALGGDPNWALTKNRSSLDKFASIVRDYNKVVSQDEQFAGVHLDIEPYLLPEWEEDKDNVITQWMMNTVHTIEEVKERSDLKVSGDFPFWIHKEKVPHSQAPLSEWMIQQYDSMTLMAYRNKAEGPNGIQSISQPIVDEAAEHEKSVVIGVNIIDTSEGSYTTFHGDDPGKMDQELKQLQNVYRGHSGFEGIAIHDYSHWINSVK